MAPAAFLLIPLLLLITGSSQVVEALKAVAWPLVVVLCTYHGAPTIAEVLRRFLKPPP